MEGSLFTYRHHNGKLVGVVSVSCQTDFAARTDAFISFGEDLAMHVATSDAESVTDLLKEASVVHPDLLVEQLLTELSEDLGEEINIPTFHKIEFGSE